MAAEPLHAEDVRLYLTDELAVSLDANGRFVLPSPPTEAYPRITPEYAGELAVAFARTFGPLVRGYLERGHGRSIDFESLRIGSPVYYGASPYAPVPSHFSPGIRNAYGPKYILYLVTPDGLPVLSVNVAAFTEAWIEEGRIRFPTWHGADFAAEGVPAGEGFQMPLFPEQAARLASSATGALVAATPELRLAGHPYSAAHARWRMMLDRPVPVRAAGDGRVQMTREIYVGLRGELTVPAAEQPGILRVHDPRSRASADLQIRPGRPVEFVRVSPQP